ncbi:META domain-containing protein [Pseudidiomarina sp. E22-M8]|uniref:META domain-containing protein n=1 Tax=Pseudidiomarina sp. E22-M8 TaxID=3424768 RepID=UPI00403C951C
MFALFLRRALLPGFTIILLAACAPQEPTETTGQTTLYNCGALRVTTVLDSNTLQLSFGDQSFKLEPINSASGARYVSADHGAEFWSKGNEAQFSTDKLALPLCVQQGTLPQQFSARGNEPFWLLNIDPQTARLRTPGDQKRFTNVSRATLNDAPPYRFKLTLGAARHLRLDEDVCYDTMSGQSFPYQATFSQQEEIWSGCAGDPQRLLTGVSWKDSRATDYVATLTFSPDSRVSGYAGCNFFTGSYTITGEGIKFSPLAVTKRMCQADAMVYQKQLLQRLTQVSNFRVFADGTLHLQLTHGDYLQFSNYPLDLPAN